MLNRGFTLIELMVVVAIIGILASIAMPAYQDYTLRAQIVESFAITSELKGSIRDYYKNAGSFPVDNKDAGLPEPHHLMSLRIKQIDMVDGAMHVQFGNDVSMVLMDKIITIRPIFVTESPTSPISWTCGYHTAPEGMSAAGEDRTTVDPKYLPLICRERRT